jgi:glycolate oxidase FAD binding subunit
MQPDAKDLPELVRELHRQGTAWLPSGLGSRLAWGAPLRQPCTPLSCAALSGIVEHNPGDFTLTVRAGTPLAEVQQALALHRQWLAVDPPWGSGLNAAGSGSIGGLVARGLSGGYRHRHMGVRDQLIGLSLLRSDGVEAKAGGRVVKNVAGYDLMRLLCGSWGSLGLISSVTLRTQPIPPARRGLLVGGSFEDLAALVGWLVSSSLTPERIDWWSAPLAAAAGLGEEPQLLIGLASVSATSLREQVQTIGMHTALACREVEAAALEGLLAHGRGQPDPGATGVAAPAWLLRLAVPGDRVAVLLARPELRGMAVELAAASGIGHAWGPSTPAGAIDAARVAALRQRCQELGGWLTVLCQPSGADLPAWLDAPSRPLIEAVKRRFDPLEQLAPGRLPGVAAGLPPRALAA